jgi:amino-acid N-acetyltransferase
MEHVTIRGALPREAAVISSLLGFYAAKGALLPRQAEEILESVRDFSVAIDSTGEVIGCAALRIYDTGLAEVRSLAVREDLLHHGFGKRLIAACEADALRNGIERVFALTYVPGFFEKLGYTRINKESLPQKIWRDCYQCPHFPNCGEIAVVKTIVH